MEENKETNTKSKETKPDSTSFSKNIVNKNRFNEGAHLVSEIKRHAPNLPQSKMSSDISSSHAQENLLEDEEEESALSQIANGVRNIKTNAQGDVSAFGQVKAAWDKIPKEVKAMIYPSLGYIAAGLGIIIIIIILIAAPAGLVQNVVSGVSSFGEKLGNFFTFQGFQTNHELVEKRETEYYETLQQVQEEFREKYQVEIDIDLITATLFYDRMMGDYNQDDTDDDNNDFEGEYTDANANSGGTDPDKAAANFYKVAKGHIKTLAKYMIIENDIYSSCSDTPSQSIDPVEEKDLAKKWGFFGGIHNLRTITNVYTYNKTFPYCEYKGDKVGYRDFFEQLETRRKELEDAGNKAELTAFLEEYYNKIEIENKVDEPDSASKNPNGNTDSSGNKRNPNNREANANQTSVQRELNEVTPMANENEGGSNQKNPNEPEVRWEMKSCSELGGVSEMDQDLGHVGCYLKDPDTVLYNASYQRESVYYYRLQEPMEKVSGLLQGKSFIENYYPEYVGEDTKEEDVKRIVDEIYSLYDMIREGSGKFTGSIGIATGEWYTWKQYDSAWKHVSLGGDPNVTLGKYGCLITSIAMQIAASGTPVSLPNFNPGTFVAAMPHAFDQNGNWLGGNTWASFAPNFKMIDQVELVGDTNVKADTIAQWISEGYYLVVRVKYNTGQHWVAITGVENGNVIMADPGDSSSTNMYSRYPETQGHNLTIKRFKG